jgi:PKD repeat protein
MAVLVKEYRNGVLIGSVERDIQITVRSCANNIPGLSGINGTTNFSMTACANTPFCFIINSNDPDAGQNLTVTWDWGIPGATFTSTSAQHPVSTFCWTPTTADIGSTHMFTVRVQDNACPYYGSQIFSYSIFVTGISVNAGPDQNTSCNGTATLTAIASGGSGTYTYQWSTGATTQSITAGAGNYTVTANDGTCSATDTVIVTMMGVPTVVFTHTSSLCSNSPVQFTDQSTTTGGIINSWSWTFGDGGTSTTQNPSHQFTSAGTYIVTLIVGNSLGCVDTVTQQLIISPPPLAAFTAANNCAGQVICFSDQSTPAGAINSWSWSFGDGGASALQNPCHTYSSSGNQTVVLIAGDTASCVDTVTNIISVYPLPSVSITPSNVCVGAVVPIAVTIPATDTIASYAWNFGNGNTSSLQNPNYVYATAGTYTITLIVTTNRGCLDFATASVTINPLPVANAGADQNICFGSSATLTATGGGTYLWNTGQTTSSITVSPATSTSYSVTVTNASGCSASDTIFVNVNPLPVANAGADVNICDGASSTLNASGGVSYNWIPTGDITSSITVSPSADQTYIVLVSDANGCTDVDTINLFVHALPVVNLSPVFVCAGQTTTLNAGAGGTTYLWNSGATTQTISIATSGNYSVTVTNSFGCSTTASCNVTVGPTINLNLGNVSFCQGDSAILDPGYTGMSYLWTTGATTQAITVNTVGTYGVTITDTAGCSGSVSSTVNVNPLPVANFNSTNVCEGNATTFTDNSNLTSGTITDWNWDFGDYNLSTQQNPTHTYLGAGTYSVMLVVTSSSGCVDTITNDVIVNPLPVANFRAINSCQNAAVVFIDSSSVLTGNIISCNWDFGDGNFSTANNPSHAYLTSGIFNVTLLVTTAGGCTNSITKPITIYPLPVAAYTNTTVCVGDSTSFANNSSVSAGTITNHSWNFGDTRTSSLQNPINTYPAAGTYNVNLIVTSSDGCISNITHPVLVNALPIANAGADQNICIGSSATLSASGGTSYSWMPGGATTSSITISPAANTTYTVTVTNASGCMRSDAVNVNVNNLPVADAGVDQAICAGSNASLTASGGTT